MLDRAVAQEPDNGAYVDSLGWAYFRLGKLELAEKYLNEPPSSSRATPPCTSTSATSSRNGATRRARCRCYRVALTLDPESKDEAKAPLEDRRAGKTAAGAQTPR